MNRLPVEKRARVLGMLVEGCSMRAASRLCDVSINTVTKLLEDVGAACAAYHDEHVRDVASRRVQCDEIWAFCYAKARNVPERLKGTPGVGDVWTWTALDADSKLIVAYHIGTRDADCALEFISDLAARLKNRVQLTTDGHKVYLGAVEEAFGTEIDYAQLIKIYGPAPDPEHRYSPAQCIGADLRPIMGDPSERHISTSFVERQNLTIRMSNRRFTRLTNAFSKKVENHAAMVALHFMHYNFARIHSTIRVTPAMEAGLSDHLWTLEDLVRLAN